MINVPVNDAPPTLELVDQDESSPTLDIQPLVPSPTAGACDLDEILQHEEIDMSTRDLSMESGEELHQRVPDEKTLRELRELFAYFDQDDSGSISHEELGAVLRLLGQDPSEEELKMLIQEADDDGSGEIEEAEFLKVITNQVAMYTKKELVDVFTTLDKDGSGTIEAMELLQMSGEDLTAKQLKTLLLEADRDGDGNIGLEEFLDVMLT